VGVLAPMVAAIIVPDPTWIGGLYDGGDGDEAATLVWDHSSAVGPVAVALLGVLTALVVVAPASPGAYRRHRCSPASRAAPRGRPPSSRPEIDAVESAPGGAATAPSFPEGSGRWRTARRHVTGTPEWCIACSGFRRGRAAAPGCSWS